MEKKLHIFRMIHRITVGIGFASILLPILFWKRIPDRIPMHFNGAGVVDAWSDKSTLILLFFVVLLLLGIVCVVEYFVRSAGMSKSAGVSEKQNLKTLYPALVLMNFFLQLMFAYIIVCCVTTRELGQLFLPVSLGCTFAPLVWYVVKYRKAGGASKEQAEAYREREKIGMEDGITYRTKIDLWLGLLLGGAVLMEIWSTVKMFLQGKNDWFMIGMAVFVTVLVVPMFFIRYTLYTDYILVDCVIFGKERIPYKSITKIQKTNNPLSSAAMSVRRIQIDYTINGSHKMTLISPVRREEFIQEVEKRRSYEHI